jgi:hypothetical protein
VKRSVLLLLVLFSVVVCPAAAFSAPVANGDFSTGLTSWSWSGDVSNFSGYALLNDSAEYALLWQGVALAPGSYLLEFDFATMLSPEVPVGAFEDSLFASLYFIDDISLFDLDTLSFGDARPLADVAVSTSDFHGGSVTSLGNGWLHYAIAFDNSFNYAIPTFELFNLNAYAGGSEGEIDNVRISGRTEVPEPGSLLLLGSALGGLWLRRKNRAH